MAHNSSWPRWGRLGLLILFFWAPPSQGSEIDKLAESKETPELLETRILTEWSELQRSQLANWKSVEMADAESMGATLENKYFASTRRWRQLVDFKYEPVDQALVQMEMLRNTGCEMQCLLEESVRAQLKQALVADRNALVEEYYRVRWLVAENRAKYYSLLVDEGKRLDIWDEGFFPDIWREFFSTFDRALGFLYTKGLIFRAKLEGGFSGIFEAARDVVYLMLVLVLPIFVLRMTRRLRPRIEEYRRSLLYTRKLGDSFSLRLANFIKFFESYLPWVAAWLGLQVASWLIIDTLFDELSSVLLLCNFYIYYRVFRLLASKAHVFLEKATGESLDASYVQLLRKTSRWVGLYFLFSAYLLYSVEFVVGRAIIYDLFFHLIVVLAVFVTTFALGKWGQLIARSLETFTGQKSIQWLADRCRSRWKWLFSLPAAILLSVVLIWRKFQTEINEFELVKTFSARLFSNRLAQVGSNDSKRSSLPQAYLDLFTIDSESSSVWAVGNDEAIAQVKIEIDEWLQDKSDEQSVAIVGERGAGKSAVLNRVLDGYESKCKVIRVEVPPKLASEEEVIQFFDDQIFPGIKDRGIEVVYQTDKFGEKIIIALDGAHHFFLGTIGGFAGYKAFAEIVNCRTENLLWCASFHRESWNYLEGVFNKTSYLRNVVHLTKWSDAEIRDLVEKRHQHYGFSVSYRNLVKGGIDKEQAEELFFRMLWEQSGGNPRVALFVWTSSVYPISESMLSVRLPERPTDSALSKLSDSCHFVFAAILRHASLTRKEIATVLQMSESEVGFALKIGLEHRVLQKELARYQVSTQWQKELTKFLRSRNYIHG